MNCRKQKHIQILLRIKTVYIMGIGLSLFHLSQFISGSIRSIFKNGGRNVHKDSKGDTIRLLKLLMLAKALPLYIWETVTDVRNILLWYRKWIVWFSFPHIRSNRPTWDKSDECYQNARQHICWVSVLFNRQSAFL